jgi:hypothetical protein
MNKSNNLYTHIHIYACIENSINVFA